MIEIIADINPIFWDYIDDLTPTQIFFGGSSSGKSFFLAQRAIQDVLRGRNYLVVRNTANTLRSSTFNEVKKAIFNFGASEKFSVNKSEMTITAYNGAQILFKGLDDVEKVKSITPEKDVITDIWVEEATETSEDDIRQLEKRLRGVSIHPKRMTLSFNPILKSHWIFKRYFSGFYDGDTLLKTDQLLILHTTYKDNKFLSSDDIHRLENETDEYWYNVYTLGLWGILGNVIFKNWSVQDLTDLIPTFDNIRNGLDFGYGPDPAAYTRMHHDRTRSRLYIFDEFAAHELTNQELAAILKTRMGKAERVICDSAEPKSIKELQTLGINAAGAEKGPDSINFGIQWLKQQEIIIDRRCQNAINEFQIYQWKKTRSGESLPIPADRDNHILDSVRYGCQDLMKGQIKIEFQSTGKRRVYSR
jgi:phage terminase large subunit